MMWCNKKCVKSCQTGELLQLSDIIKYSLSNYSPASLSLTPGRCGVSNKSALTKILEVKHFFSSAGTCTIYSIWRLSQGALSCNREIHMWIFICHLHVLKMVHSLSPDINHPQCLHYNTLLGTTAVVTHKLSPTAENKKKSLSITDNNT